MTAAKRRDLAKSFSRNASELELQIELHATGRLCGDCASKEFGSDRPKVSDVVPVIQNIERIQRDAEDPGVWRCRMRRSGVHCRSAAKSKRKFRLTSVGDVGDNQPFCSARLPDARAGSLLPGGSHLHSIGRLSPIRTGQWPPGRNADPEPVTSGVPGITKRSEQVQDHASNGRRHHILIHANRADILGVNLDSLPPPASLSEGRSLRAE